MAKTNFTKVENAFDDEMRKQLQQELLKEADRVSGNPSEENPEILKQKRIAAEKKVLLQALQHDFKNINKNLLEDEIKIDTRVLEDLLRKGILHLNDSDIEELKKIKKNIDKYKGEHEGFDEKLVEAERKKHINKRFNVKDKWLPLQ